MKENYTQQEVRLGKTYNSCLPYWLRLLIFMKRGLYNGIGWYWEWNRLFCWFGRHIFYVTFPKDQYHEDDVMACRRHCGSQFKRGSIKNLFPKAKYD